jgi:uncharacterized membrane protein YgdD (TMEM256/DUF423 family)
MGRMWLMWGCLFAFLTVAMGAFGAHAFKSILNDYQMGLIDTANRYLAYHSFALLALGLWSHWEKWSATLFAGLSFITGIILFSGSLYIFAFTEIKWFVRITPVGGSLFLLGWALFAVAIVRAKSEII